jgi:hypothetical protein
MKPEPHGFLGPMRKTTLYVAEVRLLAPSVNPLQMSDGIRVTTSTL